MLKVIRSLLLKIVDDIDAEINPMSDEQKSRLLQDEDYVDTYTRIQDMVQAESIVEKSLIYIRQRKFVKGIEE